MYLIYTSDWEDKASWRLGSTEKPGFLQKHLFLKKLFIFDVHKENIVIDAKQDYVSLNHVTPALDLWEYLTQVTRFTSEDESDPEPKYWTGLTV